MVSRLTLFVHLAGVVLFLGTFVAAWLVYFQARRTADPAAVRHLFGVVNAGDRWVTPISVVLLVVSGLSEASRRGLSITGTGWIIWSFVLLGLSGIVFVARLRGCNSSWRCPASRPRLAPCSGNGSAGPPSVPRR